MPEVKLKQSRVEVAEDCLEAARVEVLRRLKDKGLPTSLDVQRLVVVDRDDHGGWGSEWQTVRRSPLRSTEIMLQIRDESLPFRVVGLRDQLLPLAKLLNETTDLANRQPAAVVMFPDQKGEDAILSRFLTTWAHHYLASLNDLAVADRTLAHRLAVELNDFADAKRISHDCELVLSGIRLEGEIEPYKSVSLRALSSAERGAWQVFRGNLLTDDLASDPEFVVPRTHSFFNPTVMLRSTTSRPLSQRRDESQLAVKVALALILLGFEIAAPSLMTRTDQPRWATVGITHSPVPIEERMMGAARVISHDEFVSAVDMAYKMPEFDSDERNRKAIILWRVLRGSGAESGGFLDHVISLEAALLESTKLELAYKFRLYGSLFLAEERNPTITFEQLKRVYNVRSALVHGTPVKTDERRAAEEDAADLAKAVARRSLQSGWPRADELDKLALTTSFGHASLGPGPQADGQ